MDKKTVGLSGSFKANTAPKNFEKNPIKGTKYTIAVSSAKGGVGKSTFATNLALALKFLNCNNEAKDAEAKPLPRDDTTPPVTNINRVMEVFYTTES